MNVPEKQHMSREERAARRRAIADYVRASDDPAEAARDAAVQWGVTLMTVRSACFEHGIKLNSYLGGNIAGAGTFAILALLLNGDKSVEQLAAATGIAVKRINQVAAAAVKAGIKLRQVELSPGRV